MPGSALISILAKSLAAGDPSVDAAHARAAHTLGRNWKWLLPLAAGYVEAFAGQTRPRHREVVRFLRNDAGFRKARDRYGEQIRIVHWIPEAQRMQPVAAAQGWKVPSIESQGDLADWLCLSTTELDWFADLKGLTRKTANPKLRHYQYQLVLKQTGGVRLLESPKPLLKEVQRRVLSEILDQVPAHPASHGFVKGRSIATFAAPHAGRRVVLRMDLQDFFPATPAARVEAVYRTLGYPERVSALLAGLCTNSVPTEVWQRRPHEIDSARWFGWSKIYGQPHLPQGSPSSPALANIVAYRLDSRLTGLAKTAGAAYTRYADDLAFSGDERFERCSRGFALLVAAIALEEGFDVNHRKTRVMRRGTPQKIAGLVVNEKVSLPRRELDRLEAMLTNCARTGPAAQNRDGVADFRAHLEGRIGLVQMIRPDRAEWLRQVFEQIDWSGA